MIKDRLHFSEDALHFIMDGSFCNKVLIVRDPKSKFDLDT